MSLNLIMDSGSYAGNGGTQTITIGWQPAVVYITSDRSSGPPSGRSISLKNDQMPGDDFLSNNADAEFILTNGVTLTSTGFSVGSEQNVNQSGATFYWWAIRKGPWLDTGTYVGVGSGAPTVTLGRQPTNIIVAQHTAASRYGVRFFTQTFSNTMMYESQIINNLAITPISTGFQRTGSSFDAAGETYSYVALYDFVGSMRHFQSATYTGTNLLQPIALGRQPRALHIYGASDTAGMKTVQMPGNNFGHLDTAYSWETGVGNGLIISSTGFDAELGWSVNGKTYHYFAGMR